MPATGRTKFTMLIMVTNAMLTFFDENVEYNRFYILKIFWRLLWREWWWWSRYTAGTGLDSDGSKFEVISISIWYSWSQNSMQICVFTGFCQFLPLLPLRAYETKNKGFFYKYKRRIFYTETNVCFSSSISLQRSMQQQSLENWYLAGVCLLSFDISAQGWVGLANLISFFYYSEFTLSICWTEWA